MAENNNEDNRIEIMVKYLKPNTVLKWRTYDDDGNLIKEAEEPFSKKEIKDLLNEGIDKIYYDPEDFKNESEKELYEKLHKSVLAHDKITADKIRKKIMAQQKYSSDKLGQNVTGFDEISSEKLGQKVTSKEESSAESLGKKSTANEKYEYEKMGDKIYVEQESQLEKTGQKIVKKDKITSEKLGKKIFSKDVTLEGAKKLFKEPEECLVYIIDVPSENRTEIASLLVNKNYNIKLFDNVEKALQNYSEEKPDVVLIGKSKEIDTKHFMNRIQPYVIEMATYPILLLEKTHKIYSNEVKELGIVDILRKPVSKALLLYKIEYYLFTYASGVKQPFLRKLKIEKARILCINFIPEHEEIIIQKAIKSGIETYSFNGFDLLKEEIKKFKITHICVDLDKEMKFSIKHIQEIMEDAELPPVNIICLTSSDDKDNDIRNLISMGITGVITKKDTDEIVINNLIKSINNSDENKDKRNLIQAIPTKRDKIDLLLPISKTEEIKARIVNICVEKAIFELLFPDDALKINEKMKFSKVKIYINGTMITNSCVVLKYLPIAQRGVIHFIYDSEQDYSNDFFVQVVSKFIYRKINDDVIDILEN